MKKIGLRGIAAALLAAGMVTPAFAQQIDAKTIQRLEEQIRALQQQVEELKAAQTKNQTAHKDLADQVEAQGKEAVVKGDIAGSVRRAGEETSWRVYGFAELNFIKDFGGDNGDVDYSTFAPYIPLKNQSSRKGSTYLHARTSRIGVEASTPSPWGPLGVKVEGDFNNDPRTGNSAVTGSIGNIYTQQQTNSYNFRLRHAYGQVGPWLIGQYWSTFMDVDATPETVDFNGPIGSTFIRQPQIRYTYGAPNIGNFSVAVENSSSYVLDKDGAATKDGFSRVPDLVLRWDRSFDWGSISLRGVSHEMRVRSESVSASKRGYGLAASGIVKTVGSDFASWIVTGGTGIGRYFNYIEGAAYDPNNDRILTERAVGVVLGYQHKASDTFRANFSWGYQKNFENDYTRFARTQGFGSGRFGVNKNVQQAHLGFIWNPLKPVDFGAELIWARRETVAGETGSGTRLNLSTKFNFN